MRTLIKVLCGFVLFGATIWIMGAKPSAISLAGAAVGWAVGYGLGGWVCVLSLGELRPTVLSEKAILIADAAVKSARFSAVASIGHRIATASGW